MISPEEIDRLRTYGDVEVLARRVESPVRAEALRRFIRRDVIRE